MDSTLKKVVAMLSSPDEEIQCAAAKILGELGPENAEIVRALGQAASGSHLSVRCAALEALGRTKRPDALRFVLPHLTSPQVGERSRAVSAVASMGPEVLPAVFKELFKGETPVRLTLLAILQKFALNEGLEYGLHLLASAEETEVIDAVCEAFHAKVDGLSEKERGSISEKVRKWAGKPPIRRNETARVAGLRLLGALHDPLSGPFYVKLLETEASPRVLRHALLGLGKISIPERDHPRLWNVILHLLRSDQSPNLVQAATDILRRLQIPSSVEKDALDLLGHSDPAVRTLAVQWLGEAASEEAGEALGKHLSSPDWRMRQVVLSSLRKCPNAGLVLLRHLETLEDAEQLSPILQLILELKPTVSASQFAKLFRHALALRQASDRRADSLLAVLSALDREAYGRHVMGDAKNLMKKGAFQEAAACLTLLSGPDAPPAESKYLLALARFKVSDKGLGRAEREANRSLALFAELVDNLEEGLADKLIQDRDLLDRSEIYYLGFHFVEQLGNLRQFGGKLLSHLVKMSPRSPEGRDARNKLKSAGW
ncbi:MAG: HEAT repeat domain-containing protein [Planctomycetes bacterium]|nr:HEAT repeat domain-containing protein [Planctomycetota bacterium]